MVDPVPPCPRPHPRPKPIAKNPNGNAGPSSLTPKPTSSLEAGTRHPNTIEDKDEYFMKNRNHSSKTWQKPEQITKEATKPKHNKHYDSSESESGSSPRSQNKNKRAKRKKSTSIPLWQQRTDLARIPLQDPSDSDSEIEITGESRTPNRKHKRPNWSRLRSITPPPAVSQAQIQNAKNVVRQTLPGAIRQPSPSTHFDPDESTDTI